MIVILKGGIEVESSSLSHCAVVMIFSDLGSDHMNKFMFKHHQVNLGQVI
jgi:hypothetical protein